MNINEWLSENRVEKGIVILNHIKMGNQIIRTYEKNEGVALANLECKTLVQLANVIFTFDIAQSSYQAKWQTIDFNQATLLLKGILLNHTEKFRYFNQINLLSVATCSEIMQKVNLIRANGYKEITEEETNEKFEDLKQIVTLFETKLKIDNLLDDIALLKKANKILASNQLEDIKIFLLPCERIAMIKEEKHYFSRLENEFLDNISKLLNIEIQEICFLENEVKVDTLKNNNVIMSFFRGYGRFNEVSYIAYDILKNKIPFGNITVLYMSKEQEVALSSVLSGNHIPCKFLTGRTLQDNAGLGLIKSILTWAMDDFSEVMLKNVLSNAILYVPTEGKDGKEKNMLWGEHYLQYIENARQRKEDQFVLGWGFERNLHFVNHEKSHSESSKFDSILQLHQDLLDIFSYESGLIGKIRPVILYDRIIQFIKANKRKLNDEWNLVNEQLKNCRCILQYETEEMKLQDAITYIMDMLAKLTIDDEEDASSISLIQMHSMTVLERPYVYAIGLSINDFQGSNCESSVLTDKEMERLINGNALPTIQNIAKQKQDYLLLSLNTVIKGRITLGYTSYDTVNHCENSPVTLFRELLEKNNENIHNLPEFMYGNPTEGKMVPNGQVLKEESKMEYPKNTSNSTIEKLLDCPKKYAYEYVLHIKDNKEIEKDKDYWLDALHYGTCMHKIFEEYVDGIFIKNNTKKYTDCLDEKKLSEIIRNVAERMVREVPSVSDIIKEKEISEIEKVCKTYLRSLHKELLQNEWRVAETEFAFDDVKVKFTTYKENPIELIFSGIIDRIDYRIDKKSKQVVLRLIDYKTGKMELKKRDNKQGKVIQHSIYKKAIMNETVQSVILQKIAKLEENEKLKEATITLESFNYIFPKEDDDNAISFEITQEDLSITRLLTCLTVMQEEGKYPDRFNLIEKTGNYVNVYSSKDSNLGKLYTRMYDKEKKVVKEAEKNACLYCEYKDFCDDGKDGSLK